MKIIEVISALPSVEEGWKDRLANIGIAGAMALGGAGGMAIKDKFTSPNAAKTPVSISTPAAPEEPAAISVNVKPITGKPLEELLLKTAHAAGIQGVELAAFLAQCHHESDNFNKLKEWTGKHDPIKYFNKKYDLRFSPHTAKILGNTKAGDGVKYHGRGFIQLTGRDNYRMAQEGLKKMGIDLPLVQNPNLAEVPANAAKIAIWYWKSRVAPFVNDFEDVAAVTRKINPALRGLADRKETFSDYIEMANDSGSVAKLNEGIYGRNYNKIYNMLIDATGGGPFDGGCVVMADAIQQVVGGSIVVLVGTPNRQTTTLAAQHAVVALGDLLIDGDGPLPARDLIRRFEKNEISHHGGKITSVRPIEPYDLPEASRDHDAAVKIAKLLKI